MYWKNDGQTIITGPSLKECALGIAATLLTGFFLAAIIYRIEQDRIFDKPLDQIATTPLVWIGLIVGALFAVMSWATLFSSRSVQLFKGSKLVRINKTAFFIIRWARDFEVKQIRVSKVTTVVHKDIQTTTGRRTLVHWSVDLIPAPSSNTAFGQPIFLYQANSLQAAVDKARDAHLLTGLPAFKPDGTPIW